MATDKPSWVIVKTFTRGSASAEVSRAGDTGKFSYRLSWRDGERQGPWFPDRGISYLGDIAEVASQAEAHCLVERDRYLVNQETKLGARKKAEDGKRRSHDEEVAVLARKTRKGTR